MDIEKEIIEIKARNKRVDGDKAWERSKFRIIIVSLLTYIVVVIVFNLIGVESYLLSALIPTIGYILSTFTIPVVKKWWLKNRYDK
ncbi:MAG: hypothetical protein WCP14_03830 [bacterium]